MKNGDLPGGTGPALDELIDHRSIELPLSVS
jgi:hypothetical protein